MQMQNLAGLLLTAAILLALLGKLILPEGVLYLRQEAARILAADAQNRQLIEAMGRSLSEDAWRRELAEAIRRQIVGIDT